MKIFLDIDGVLADFITAACKLFGVTVDEFFTKCPLATWVGIHPALNTDTEGFYNKLAEAGAPFWENLEHYPWSNELFDYCASLTHTAFLTAPTPHSSCSLGKVQWIQKWKGEKFLDFVVTYNKEYCSKWDHLLIDDRDENCQKFIDHGGEAILFPTYHNSNHRLRNDALAFTKERIKEWHERMTKEHYLRYIKTIV